MKFRKKVQNSMINKLICENFLRLTPSQDVVILGYLKIIYAEKK